MTTAWRMSFSKIVVICRNFVVLIYAKTNSMITKNRITLFVFFLWWIYLTSNTSCGKCGRNKTKTQEAHKIPEGR